MGETWGTLPLHKFPPSSVAIADATGINPLDIRPPAGEAWKILGFTFIFTASAVAASRRVWYRHIDSGVVLDFLYVLVTHPAGSVILYSVTTNVRAAFSSLNTYAVLPIDNECILTNKVYINVGAIDGQAGDTYTGVVCRVERFLDV